MRNLMFGAAIGLAVASLAVAQRPSGTRPMANPAAAQFMHAQIVNVNPQAGMMTLRTGSGATAREEQFRLAEKARLFNSERMAIREGLAHNGFKPGTNVFFRTGDPANMITDLRMFDPAAAAMTGRITRGEIVSVDPTTGMLVIRTGSGAGSVEHRFHVNRHTRFLDRELLALENGLAFNGFAAGAPVWFAPGVGSAANTLAGLSLANPVVAEAPVAGNNPAAPPEPGTGAPIPSKYLAGHVVGVDPEGHTITVKVGSGDNAAEQTLKVPMDATFFGPDKEPLQEGLKYEGLKPGADVWMRVGTGELANTVRELTLHDPNRKDK
jgi:hypothetical protein